MRKPHFHRSGKMKFRVYIDSEIKELIPRYLNKRENDIRSFLVALETGDWETVRHLGNAMEESGSVFGFEIISSIGRAIKTAVETRDFLAVAREVQKLSSYLNSVDVAYC